MTEASLFRIADEDLWYQIRDSFGEAGGIYAVLAMKNEKIIPIPRLLGSDPEGRLYIGKANSFLDRVIDLKKSTAPSYSSSSHEFGVRYKANERLQQQFPYSNLFLHLVGIAEASSEEKAQLQAYCEQFGELPPLNRNM